MVKDVKPCTKSGLASLRSKEQEEGEMLECKAGGVGMDSRGSFESGFEWSNGERDNRVSMQVESGKKQQEGHPAFSLETNAASLLPSPSFSSTSFPPLLMLMVTANPGAHSSVVLGAGSLFADTVQQEAVYRETTFPGALSASAVLDACEGNWASAEPLKT